MDFNRIKNDTAGAEVPFFKLPNGSDMIRDARSEKNYFEYRAEYKRVCGVMPELDKVNNPNCAVLCNYVFLPEDIKNAKKQGRKKVAGESFDILMSSNTTDVICKAINLATNFVGHELFPEFERAFDTAVSKYKYAYSLLLSHSLDYIKELPVGSYISSDNLGYRKTNEGDYFEGTWQDNEFLYGLCVPANESFAFIGTFGADGQPEEGVMYDGSCSMGLFKNNQLNCAHGIMIETNGDEIKQRISVGGFEDDRWNGTVIRYVHDSEDRLFLYKDEFDYGELKKLPRSKQVAKNFAWLGKGYIKLIRLYALIASILGVLIGFVQPQGFLLAIPGFAVWGGLTYLKKKKGI